MSDPAFDYVATIITHSDGFAAAAGHDLDAPVEHLTDVHWFWGTIVAEELTEPPHEGRRPAAVPREQLIVTFRLGAERLATVLRAASPSQVVWTWAPAQPTAGFVIRHQVQEAAVHHWDAAHAAGTEITIAPAIAADAIEEFLTVSVSSPDDPAAPEQPALGAAFRLACADFEAAWTISDAATPGTITFAVSADAATPTISATAADLLLWLYGRVSLDTTAVSGDVIDRFRALCFTS